MIGPDLYTEFTDIKALDNSSTLVKNVQLGNLWQEIVGHLSKNHEPGISPAKNKDY